MKHLEPTQYLVNSMEVLSLSSHLDRGVIERRIFIGHFSPDISFIDVQRAIGELGLWRRLVGVLSPDGGKVSQVSRVIDRGVIFESVEEFIELLKRGILYSDIVDGCAMAQNLETRRPGLTPPGGDLPLEDFDSASERGNRSRCYL